MLKVGSTILVRDGLGISTVHKAFSTTNVNNASKKFKLLVVGGGSGGCSVAAKFRSKFGKDDVAIVDPAEMHYYQPMWTLVGGGMKSLTDTGRPMKDVIPQGVKWIPEKVTRFDPKNKSITLGNADILNYDYLVVAIGLQLKYDQVKGLPAALQTAGVCSNYSPLYVQQTWEALQKFKSGNAIFTFPNTPIKCPGAPQKILYIAEDYFRREGKLKNAKLIYNTSLGVLFGAKHYANALWKVVESRPNIQVNLRRNLVEVIPASRKAIFQNLDNPSEYTSLDYELLHVTPPQAPPDALKGDLSDTAGFLDVNKATLQHQKYPNVFGLGDCTNSPNSKTAAAAAAQCGVVYQNLTAVMDGKQPTASYDGYASCPLVTSNRSCILAEFDYTLQPLETFPIDQAKERRSMFYLKKDMMPYLYWEYMLKGRWNGPKVLRKMMHLGMGN